MAGARSTVDGTRVPTWFAVVLLTLVGAVVPIVLAQHFGALGIPRNDDWAYVRAAFEFGDHGTLNGSGAIGKTLVGQLLLALPVTLVLGERISALQVEVAVLGTLGLLAVFDLAKRLISAPAALLVAVMVGVGPMWASLSASFMTDVPLFALVLISLAIGARSVRSDGLHVGGFVGALAVGVLAFSVREHGIVAPVAVGLAALWASARWDRPRRGLIIGALVGVVVIAGVILGWTRSLPGWAPNDPQRLSLDGIEDALRFSARSAVALGIMVVPAVFLAGPRRILRSAWASAPTSTVVVGVATAGLLLINVISQWRSLLLLGPGNYFTRNGVLRTDVIVDGFRPDLFRDKLQVLLALVGVFATTVMVLGAVRPAVTAARRRPLLTPPASPGLAIVALAAIGLSAMIVLQVALVLPGWDRYLLPLVPLLGILVIRGGAAQATAPARRDAWVVATVALVGLAVLGFVYAANSASFDGGRWKVAREAARIVGGRDRVNGGFEWMNYHAGKLAFFEVDGTRNTESCVFVVVGTDPTERGIAATRLWTPPLATKAWIVARQQRLC